MGQGGIDQSLKNLVKIRIFRAAIINYLDKIRIFRAAIEKMWAETEVLEQR